MTLKGNFIWGGFDGRLVHLDGEGFGEERADGRAGIRLPSGDGLIGGDFEMWFWLVSQVFRRIGINSSTLEELTDLPGIVPSLAESIVANRPFSRVEDLLTVPGISERMLRRFRERIEVE